MSRLGRRAVAVALVLAFVLTGCVSADMAAPFCEDGRNTLVLMAQSIPEADFVPCLTSMPSGWFFNEIEVKSGESRVTMSNDAITGGTGVTMTFTSACATGDAVEVPSDEPDARRFEDVRDIQDGYQGTSYYVFDGGCVRVSFDVRGERWSALVNDVASAIRLESRGALERYVRDYSDGIITRL